MEKALSVPALALVVLFIYPAAAPAQDSAELVARMKAMEERIKSLETEIQELKSQQAATTAALTAGTPATDSASAQTIPARSRPT